MNISWFTSSLSCSWCHHIHSEHTTNVSWHLVNRWSSCCVFLHFYNNLKQIVLLLSSVRNRTSTTTYTMWLCCHIYSKQFVCSSQAAAMEASSSCRPWGWGETKKMLCFYIQIRVTANSLVYMHFCDCVTLTKMRWGRKRLSVCVLVAGQRGRLMLSCGSVW